MKYIEIVMMVLLLNVSMAVINAAQLVETYQLQPTQSWFDLVGKDTIKDDEYFQSSAVQSASSNFGFGDFVKGLAIFLATFAFGVVAVPFTLMQFGMTGSIAGLLSIPVYVSYALAIGQYVSNRSTKGMG